MWRLKLLVVLAALIGALVYGAAVANGAWWWNAWWWNAWWWNSENSAEGVDFRSAWKVVPEGSSTAVEGDEFNYFAEIELRVPKNADFSLVGQSVTETVTLNKIGALECLAGGIEVQVKYRVTPLEGAAGDLVKVWVTADGAELASAEGPLDTLIWIDTVIPAEMPACYIP